MRRSCAQFSTCFFLATVKLASAAATVEHALSCFCSRIFPPYTLVLNHSLNGSGSATSLRIYIAERTRYTYSEARLIKRSCLFKRLTLHVQIEMRRSSLRNSSIWCFHCDEMAAAKNLTTPLPFSVWIFYFWILRLLQMRAMKFSIGSPQKYIRKSKYR